MLHDIEIVHVCPAERNCTSQMFGRMSCSHIPSVSISLHFHLPGSKPYAPDTKTNANANQTDTSLTDISFPVPEESKNKRRKRQKAEKDTAERAANGGKRSMHINHSSSGYIEHSKSGLCAAALTGGGAR